MEFETFEIFQCLQGFELFLEDAAVTLSANKFKKQLIILVEKPLQPIWITTIFFRDF